MDGNKTLMRKGLWCLLWLRKVWEIQYGWVRRSSGVGDWSRSLHIRSNRLRKASAMVSYAKDRNYVIPSQDRWGPLCPDYDALGAIYN